MADQSVLSSRAIMGMYFARQEVDAGGEWMDRVANLYTSDQAGETYAFLGQSPMMREWVGERDVKSFSGNGVTIVNKHYEATIEVRKRDARRDKTSQVQARIDEFYDRAKTHWNSLISAAILAGPTTVCYDGQFFFDTDHSEGDSGTQSNSISFDLSAAPAVVHGSVTAPSVEEMQQAILAGATAIMSFKDDKGEPMNEGAREFIVMVGAGLYPIAVAATQLANTGSVQNNMNPNVISGLNIKVAMNTRLNAWTDKFAMFRTDSPIKALIRQTEQDVELKAKAEGSEFEFDFDAWQFGIDAWRGVGYGYWQRAVLVTLVA